MFRNLLLATAGLFLAANLPAAAQSATLLGVFSDWSVYSAGSGTSKTCYILAKPRKTLPNNVRRGSIFLMVSDWPGRKVKAEPQIVYGYPTEEGGPASLDVDNQKYTFFMRNLKSDGSGWLKSLDENDALVADMRKGTVAVARGLSTRGTTTIDTYSLVGFSAALDKAHAACGMS